MNFAEKSKSHLIQQQTSDRDCFFFFFFGMKRKKIHLNYIFTCPENAFRLLFQTEEKRRRYSSKTSLLWVFIGVKTTTAMACCARWTVQKRENGCVNDPIPAGHIQFISSTSRSKDFSVLISIYLYQFPLYFFPLSCSTLSFFIGEIILQVFFFVRFNFYVREAITPSLSVCSNRHSRTL